MSSGTPCYACEGLGTVPDGLDSWGDSRDRICSHCGGSGQEPDGEALEGLPAAPPAPRGPTYGEAVCPHCTAKNCASRGRAGLVFCWGDPAGSKRPHAPVFQ
jgi:hypothetical protein